MAANYLGVEGLENICCNQIAKMIKGDSLDEIRESVSKLGSSLVSENKP